MAAPRYSRGHSAPEVRLHPHLLRHSIAVHLLQHGADVRYIQQFLGHANLDTTKVYLRLVPGRLKEDYDRAMPEIAVGLEAEPPAPRSTP
jgi:site-specific recombinase XerD